jgi:hypothetical protein
LKILLFEQLFGLSYLDMITWLCYWRHYICYLSHGRPSQVQEDALCSRHFWRCLPRDLLLHKYCLWSPQGKVLFWFAETESCITLLPHKSDIPWPFLHSVTLESIHRSLPIPKGIYHPGSSESQKQIGHPWGLFQRISSHNYRSRSIWHT